MNRSKITLSQLENFLFSEARHSRELLVDDLSALVPLIEQLGGQAAIEEFFCALRDVTIWGRERLRGYHSS